jgi:hypothetical protein
MSLDLNCYADVIQLLIYRPDPLLYFYHLSNNQSRHITTDTLMRTRQSIDLTGHPDTTLPTSSTHRRSISHVNGHARRPSQSLGGAATLELIQAQAANQAQGGDANPVALVNSIAAQNNGLDPGLMHPGAGYMNGLQNPNVNDLNHVAQSLAGLQVNNQLPPIQQMNGTMGGYGMNGMNGMNGINGMNANAGGSIRRGRMSTGPGQGGPVFNPYGHMGMNGKLPGMNGMVSV